MYSSAADKEVLVKPADAAKLFKQHSKLEELVIVDPEWKDSHEHVEVEMYNPELEFKHSNKTIAVVKYWPSGEKYLDYITGVQLRISRVSKK
jgi:hypothetical protein